VSFIYVGNELVVDKCFAWHGYRLMPALKQYFMKPNLTFSKFSLFPAATVLAAIVLGSSCQKSDRQISNVSLNQQRLEVTNTVVEATSDDEENFELVMEDQTTESANVSNAVVAGKTVTYSPSKDVYPHTKTIDYGNGENGGNKRGKIVITYFDSKADANGKFSVTTYQDYYANNAHIEGSIQINKIKNGSGQKVFLHLIDKKITTNGNVKDFKSNSKWTVIDWKGGSSNAYQIEEHSTGKQTYNGVALSFVTDTDKDNPIIKPFDCKRVQGILNSKLNLGKGNKLDEVVDYGNGECDNIVTLSINGGTPKEVTLPLRFWPLN